MDVSRQKQSSPEHNDAKVPHHCVTSARTAFTLIGYASHRLPQKEPHTLILHAWDDSCYVPGRKGVERVWGHGEQSNCKTKTCSCNSNCSSSMQRDCNLSDSSSTWPFGCEDGQSADTKEGRGMQRKRRGGRWFLVTGPGRERCTKDEGNDVCASNINQRPNSVKELCAQSGESDDSECPEGGGGEVIEGGVDLPIPK